MGRVVLHGRTVPDVAQPHFIPALIVPTNADIESHLSGRMVLLPLHYTLFLKVMQGKAALLSSIYGFQDCSSCDHF